VELVIVAWLFLAVGVGYAADQRGLSGFGWFIIALLVSAPLALLFLIAAPADAGMVDDRALRRNIRKGRAS
jgi:hypothetical protein